MDKDKAVIQCDTVGWKVVCPDGQIRNKLVLEDAAAALMAWNYPVAHHGEEWWRPYKR